MLREERLLAFILFLGAMIIIAGHPLLGFLIMFFPLLRILEEI